MSLYCIRDAGGIRQFLTYLSREAAEREIERIEGPGCRAPFDVVEFVEATPMVRAADSLFQACDHMWKANISEPGSYVRAFQAVQSALQAARPRS